MQWTAFSLSLTPVDAGRDISGTLNTNLIFL